MSPPTQHEQRFADYLKRLADGENRAALAALRRGLGKHPGEVADPSPYVDPWLSPDMSRRDEEAYYVLAALFGLHPVSWAATDGDSASRNFGASLGRLVAENNGGAVQRRFIAALNSHSEDLAEHLRHLVGLLRAKETPVDWAQLLHDVRRWDSPRRLVQRQWARAFWRDLPEEVGGGAVPRAEERDETEDPG